MAIPIEKSRIPASTYVDITSRYVSSQVIYWGEKRIATFETYKRNMPVLSKTDKLYLITAATQFRPDIVSNMAYGISSYWWKIMEVNGIKDISDFKLGVTIRIPESLF